MNTFPIVAINGGTPTRTLNFEQPAAQNTVASVGAGYIEPQPTLNSDPSLFFWFLIVCGAGGIAAAVRSAVRR